MTIVSCLMVAPIIAGYEKRPRVPSYNLKRPLELVEVGRSPIWFASSILKETAAPLLVNGWSPSLRIVSAETE